MRFNTFGEINLLRLEDSIFNKTIHGFFTRNGGVSPDPWKSLNLSVSVGDTDENVKKNRKKVFDIINRPLSTLFDVWQVHSAKVVCATKPRQLCEDHIKADAILTDNPIVTILMRFADCVPILFYDPTKNLVGIAHAGWQGTINNIAKAVVEKMTIIYKSDPLDIVTAIGPSIGPDHYLIGNDVYEKARIVFNEIHDEVFTIENNKIQFNLWKANEYLLRMAGVKNVTTSGICTACDIEHWYSHRAEGGNTGRFAAVIAPIG